MIQTPHNTEAGEPRVDYFTVCSHGSFTPAEPARRPRKQRKQGLASLLKQAAKAGKSVKGAEVYQDRTVLQFGEPEPTDASNPWPLDEFRTKETKQ